MAENQQPSQLEKKVADQIEVKQNNPVVFIQLLCYQQTLYGKHALCSLHVNYWCFRDVIGQLSPGIFIGCRVMQPEQCVSNGHL